MAASPAAGHTARPQAASERITVALMPAAADHLRRLQQRTNLSKTDLANRAITSYEFLNNLTPLPRKASTHTTPPLRHLRDRSRSCTA